VKSSYRRIYDLAPRIIDLYVNQWEISFFFIFLLPRRRLTINQHKSAHICHFLADLFADRRLAPPVSLVITIVIRVHEYSAEYKAAGEDASSPSVYLFFWLLRQNEIAGEESRTRTPAVKEYRTQFGLVWSVGVVDEAKGNACRYYCGSSGPVGGLLFPISIRSYIVFQGRSIQMTFETCMLRRKKVLSSGVCLFASTYTPETRASILAVSTA
jgi:hypothetical protein